MTGVVDKSSTLEQNWRKRLLVVIGLCSIAFCIGIPCTTQVVHAPLCCAVVAPSHFAPSRSRPVGWQLGNEKQTELSQFVYSVRSFTIEIIRTCCEGRPTEGGKRGGGGVYVVLSPSDSQLFSLPLCSCCCFGCFVWVHSDAHVLLSFVHCSLHMSLVACALFRLTFGVGVHIFETEGSTVQDLKHPR